MDGLLNVEAFFSECLESVGHPFNGKINFDSDWQRYPCPESKSSKTSASYMAHSDGRPTLKFWCGKCGLSQNFSYGQNNGHKLSEIDRQAIKRKNDEKERLSFESHKRYRDQMNELWGNAVPCSSHLYINSKQMSLTEEDGLRVTPDGVLLCPVNSDKGELLSLQRIYWNKGSGKFEKRFLKGLSPKNGFHILGNLDLHRQVYFAEGIATALAVKDATSKPVVCVYGKHFDTIAPVIASAYPDKQFIFCADAELATNANQATSEDNAKKAVSMTGGRVCLPDFSEVPVTVSLGIPRSDFNDLFMLLHTTGLNRGDAVIKLKAQLISQPTIHSKLLEELIKKIKPVDFRMLAEVDEKEKIKQKHFVVLVIEQVLALAETNQWGICRNHEFIYLFNGEYWNLLDVDELKSFLGKAAEAMGVDKFTARHFHFREHLYKQFLAVANLPKPPSSKDTISINLRNGTFEITPEEIRLKEFNRSDFMTYQLGFDYNPEAKAPLFSEYLNKVLPDVKKQQILAEYLGYVFVKPSILKLEKTLLLYGTGANGKSVFYEIVRKLLGEHNTSEFSLQNLTNDNGYYRAMIANKLVNYASEINGKLETAVFKQLVSGEPVDARLPYGKPFTVTEYAKMIFNCNELPKDVEPTEAYFRRFLIVPFDVTIPEAEQDKQLAHKITTNELSGIFNWVLNGLHRILKQKQFTACESVQQARAKYERESDSVKLFIHECNYVPSANNYVSTKIFYQEYREFCIDDGFKPVNSTSFRNRLESMNIVIERKTNGNVVYVLKHRP